MEGLELQKQGYEIVKRTMFMYVKKHGRQRASQLLGLTVSGLGHYIQGESVPSVGALRKLVKLEHIFSIEERKQLEALLALCEKERLSDTRPFGSPRVLIEGWASRLHAKKTSLRSRTLSTQKRKVELPDTAVSTSGLPIELPRVVPTPSQAEVLTPGFSGLVQVLDGFLRDLVRTTVKEEMCARAEPSVHTQSNRTVRYLPTPGEFKTHNGSMVTPEFLDETKNLIEEVRRRFALFAQIEDHGLRNQVVQSIGDEVNALFLVIRMAKDTLPIAAARLLEEQADIWGLIEKGK